MPLCYAWLVDQLQDIATDGTELSIDCTGQDFSQSSVSLHLLYHQDTLRRMVRVMKYAGQS